MQRREKSRAGTPTGPLDGDRMDLEEQLLAERSRRNTDLIVRWIGADAKRLARARKVLKEIAGQRESTHSPQPFPS